MLENLENGKLFKHFDGKIYRKKKDTKRTWYVRVISEENGLEYDIDRECFIEPVE